MTSELGQLNGNFDRLDAADWIYKAEGNANIVLNYTGGNARFIGRVLRLRKAASHRILDSSDQELEEAKSNQTFTAKVMAPLIGPKFIDAGEIIGVDPDFLLRIKEKIEPFRPQARKKLELNTSCSFGILLRDHSSISGHPTTTFSVEIKPKWGFLPYSPAIRSENSAKFYVCRYCMWQHYKVDKGEVDEVCEYCPQDLFSKSPDRVLTALRALIKLPQNNMKVYANGELVFGGKRTFHVDISSLASTASTATAAESSEFERYLNSALARCGGGLDSSDELCSVLCEILCQSDVLDGIRRAQELDSLDIEGLYPLFEKLKAERPDLATDASLFSPSFGAPPTAERHAAELAGTPPALWHQRFDGRSAWLGDDKDRIKISCFPTHLPQPLDISTQPAPSEPLFPDPLTTHNAPLTPDLETCQLLLRNFLVSHVAKDCSLLVTFAEVSGSEERDQDSTDNVVKLPNGRAFRSKVGVVDLEPKEVKRVPGYLKIDQDIVNVFLRNVEAKQKK